MDFCVSLIFFLNSKKTGGKSPAKITKSAKLRQFLMSILEGLKWFSEKYSREEISSFYYSFSIAYIFLLYEHPKGTKIETKHENPLFFKKRFLQKVLGFLQKFNKCGKKFSQHFFSTQFISKICFWMLYQHVPKKNLRKLEQLMRDSEKTAFPRVNTDNITLNPRIQERNSRKVFLVCKA